MNRYAIIVSVAIAMCGGIFFFFHVPKQSCSTLRDPSGMPSVVCAPTAQSPYQKMYLALHQYFFPKDSCFVNIETGNVDCRPFLTTGCDQGATTTDCSTLPKPSQPEPQPYIPPTSATGTPAFVSVGDVLGAMTVVSVAPFNTGQYSSDPKMMQLGLQNARITLRGPIEVTGAYSAVHSGIGFDGYCMSVSDAASLSRLPVLSTGVRSYFCFRNSETARQKLGEKSRTITVKIDNFELNSYPAEVMDWADLISVFRE